MKKYFVLATALFTSAAFAAPRAPEAVPGEYVVKLKPAYSLLSANKTSLAQSLGAQVQQVLNQEGDLLLVKTQGSRAMAVQSLESSGLIEYAEPNYIYRIGGSQNGMLPDDAQFGALWGMKNTGQVVQNVKGLEGVDLNVEKAWQITTGSKDVIVGVIDTGVDFTIPDLAENAWVNEAEANGKPGVDDDKNGYVDDINGYNFVGKKGDSKDDHGHGSHVAGTIGARGNNQKDVAGVNWNVRIMALKFLSAQGSGSLADAILAIDYATKMGAHLTNNSWGGGGFSQALMDSIKRASDKSILFIAAAGNNGTNNDVTAQYPANYNLPNVISVAAISNDGTKASFSCYGLKTVHIAAPGNYILSTIPIALDTQDGKKDGLASWRGTSMATPHVAGVAALVLSKYPGMTAADLKDRILKTAVPLASMKGISVTGGLLNAHNALTNTIPPPDVNDPSNWPQVDFAVASPHPYADNSSATYTITIPGAKSIAALFSKFETEVGYDYLRIYDSTGKEVGVFSGVQTGKFTPAVVGDTMKLVFSSDGSVNGFGFDISKVAVKN
jgi:thermitase